MDQYSGWIIEEGPQLYSFRLSDGMRLRTETFDGGLRGLGAAGEVIFVGTLKGKVYAYRP